MEQCLNDFGRDISVSNLIKYEVYFKENEDQKKRMYYYRDKGWFESDYYYKTALGPIKKLSGHFFDFLGRRVIKICEDFFTRECCIFIYIGPVPQPVLPFVFQNQKLP